MEYKKSGDPRVKNLLKVLEGWDGKLEGLEPPELASFRAALEAVRLGVHKSHKRSSTVLAKTLKATGLSED